MIGKKLISFLSSVWGKGFIARIAMITLPVALTGGITMGILLTENSETKKQPISTVKETDSAEEEPSNESSTDILVDEEKNSEDTLNTLGDTDKTNDEDMDVSSQNSNEKTSEKPQDTNTKQESQSTTKPPVREEATQETKPLIPQEKIDAQRVINQGYRDFLIQGGAKYLYEGVMYQFGVTDINGDGVEELLFYTYDPKLNQDNGPDFMMTYDGEVCGSGQGFGAMSNTEYCVETKHFIETRYYVDGSYDFAVYEFDGKYFGTESFLLDGKEDVLAFHVDKNGKYSAHGGPGNIYYDQKLTDEQVSFIQQTIKEYLPSRTKATAPYQINEENLNKYLPIDDAGIIEQLRAK